ncbi:MAG: AAA family ATPase, partial [Gammaproteobacteria bacterium]
MDDKELPLNVQRIPVPITEIGGNDADDCLRDPKANAELYELEAEAVAQIGKNMEKAKQEEQTNRLVVDDIISFSKLQFPPRKKLLGEWLLSQSIGMVHAYRGIGKTYFALNVAYAVATGGEYLGWEAPNQCEVLYIDGEMAADSLQERIAGMILASEIDDDRNIPFNIITPDRQLFGMPDINTWEGRALINEAITESTKL